MAGDDGLGGRFYLWLAGGAIAVGIAMFVIFLLISKAFIAWGFLGAFIVMGIALLIFGWIYDRREKRNYPG